MTAKDEAKQLDSVTDRFEENEACDTSKATAAMSSLMSKEQLKNDAIDLASIEVSKDDVDLIVNQLDVTDELATKALKEVLGLGLVVGGRSAVGEALRRLVVS
jgi:NACalpha-BTF3-like transcription factor